jgi:phosphomannomutase
MTKVTHSFDPTAIREYDIRGVVGKTLSSDDAYAVGCGFATMLREAGGRKAAVGYDGRLSSPSMEAALVEGLRDGGISVLRVGLGPTPMLYFAVRALALDGGVMVTGSHNPAEYNGFKMMLGKGAFYGAQIRRIAEIAAAGAYSAGPRGSAEDRPVLDDYVARL